VLSGGGYIGIRKHSFLVDCILAGSPITCPWKSLSTGDCRVAIVEEKVFYFRPVVDLKREGCVMFPAWSQICPEKVAAIYDENQGRGGLRLKPEGRVSLAYHLQGGRKMQKQLTHTSVRQPLISSNVCGLGRRTLQLSSDPDL
jgi:hypothetical protein